MKALKVIIGIIIGIAGVVAGIWLGIWWFIAGVVDVVDGATAEPVNGAQIGWGLAQVIFLSELVLVSVPLAGLAIGAAIASSEDKPKLARSKVARLPDRDFRNFIHKSNEN
jgi:hypothetical protein